MATKKQKVISEFAHLSQFLEEQQSVLLAQLERLDGDILKHRDEFDVLVTGEICRFNTLIEELEEKNQRPARDLLTVRSELCPRSPMIFGIFAHLSHLSYTRTSLYPKWKMGHRTQILNSKSPCVPKSSPVTLVPGLGIFTPPSIIQGREVVCLPHPYFAYL